MVWTARPDGSPDYFNRRWDEFTGFSEDEYGNWIWQKILHPEDVERYNDTWHGAVESGSAYEIECRFRDYRAGSYRWFLGRAEPVRDEAGRIVKWFGTCTDINEQKLAVIERDKLLRKENEARKIAENANRLKDEFLATVSHELRTPLNAILGWSSIAQSPGTDTAAMKRALEIIVRSARSQHQIIEDILDVSRIITGKLILNIESVELIPVIYSALDSIRPALEAKKIRLKTDFDKKAEIISGDSNRLQQIVWNLLSNAAKFTQPEGEIAVLLKRSGNYAELSICDSGNGISPDFLPFVFERFTQADGSSTRRYGGLGLGLAIARHLVELHGGNIYAHSDGVGCGSVFTVNLPLAIMQSGIAEPLPPSRETKSRETSNIPKTALSGVKVLVVDDESDARELLKVILGQYGAEVITAESAEEALNNLSLSLPHVLVSDIGMPGSDGYELIRRVRNYPPASRLHAVALTAYAGKEDRERALSEGFNDYLSKPVEASELIEIVARLNGRG
jgi:PAS domain S-box-containing protein